jgi:hypothetical protein
MNSARFSITFLAVFLCLTTITNANYCFAAGTGPAQLSLQDFPNVPEKPLRHFLQMLAASNGKTFSLRESPNKFVVRKIEFRRYAVIIDFSQPSSERRLYLLDLYLRDSQSYLVAHGVNSGTLKAEIFSNVQDSLTSSLGFYLTDEVYVGQFGLSLKLIGMEPTNDQAYERNIVMHGADYVSESYLALHGQLGRSEGCVAVDLIKIQDLIAKLQGGSILYIYHPQLEDLKPSMLMVPTGPPIHGVGRNKK